MEIQELNNQAIIIKDFDFHIFNQKLMFIENVLHNQTIHGKELQINVDKEKNKQIVGEISKVERNRKFAENLRNKIEKKKTQIEKLEFEEVGPYLLKIYTKVIKHTNLKELSLKRDSASKTSGGATFSDQQNNNLLNILSQGQLGVFMLAYFFANMFKRKSETMFNVYFVDDITSCMDDMNVLSFVDIIKYQLYREDGVIKQLFFSTCDGDLEKLFIHKMRSFGIDWMNIKFNSYAKGIVMDCKGKNISFT